jgi:hypothetical protein
MFRKVTPYITFLICSIIFYSCTYDIAEDLPCDNIPESVSFSNDILPLVRSHCSTPGCHSGNDPGGNLNLEDSQAYNELWKPGRGYINTAKPNFSVLYSQMISVSQPMPPTGRLSACKTNLILRWIEQGAKNN